MIETGIQFDCTDSSRLIFAPLPLTKYEER
jgi:hypothetical protein